MTNGRAGYRSPPHRPDPHTHITPREREVLALLATGLHVDGTAARLDCSAQTVKFHMHKLYTRWCVTGVATALVRALALGVFSAEDVAQMDAAVREREGGI